MSIARALAAPVAVAALALLISVPWAAVPSVWYDEVATVSGATRSLPQLWSMLGNVDVVHGLYYLGMHAVFDLLGYSPFTLRLPSAIAVAVTAALVVVLGRRLQGPALGLSAGIAFCLIPRVAWMAVEGRSYALSALFATLLTILLLRALDRPGRRWWAGYAVVAVLGCLTFFYFALVVLAHGVAVALFARAGIRRWAVASGVAAVVLAPFGAVALGQSSQLPAMGPLGVAAVGDVLVGQWFDGNVAVAVVAWALVAFGAAAQGRMPRLGLLVAALVIPTAVLVAAALVNPELYQPRYLGMCAPFLALAIGSGAARLARAPLMAVALAALALLAVPSIVAQRQPEAKKDGAWAEVAEVVQRELATDGPDAVAGVIYGAIFPHRGATARVISYGYPDAFDGVIDVTLDTPAHETGELWETARPLSRVLDRLDGATTLYLITTAGDAVRAQAALQLRIVGWSPRFESDYDGIWVIGYERVCR